MTIEQELISFLRNQNHESTHEARNIEIVTAWYGFRSHVWPTFEQLAEEEYITRARAHQLINRKFRDIADLGYFPSLDDALKILQSKKYWLYSDLEAALTKSKAIGDSFSIPGLLRLFDELHVAHGFAIYTPELEKVSRMTFEQHDQKFVIAASVIGEIKSLYKAAVKLPGLCGLAQLEYLRDKTEEFEKYAELLKHLIRFSENSWAEETEDTFWYLFEKRDNTLINYSEKIFSVIDECPVKRLAETYHNALHARTPKNPYPSVELIEHYLRSSVNFELDGDLLRFNGAETRDLSEIEVDVFEYLKTSGPVSYPEFKEHLLGLGKGYGKDSIIKQTMKSPLVFQDKSKGRTNYEYSLVGTPTVQEMRSDRRYRLYLKKLRKLAEAGTDRTTEQKQRREQMLLQQYLFEGKEHEHCAICGRLFNTKALVTAHKMKRAQCSEDERLDPYIVMPLCVFGCDYLYENEFLRIDKGEVRITRAQAGGVFEDTYMEKVDGRRVAEQWLKGNERYFSRKV